MDIIDLDIQDKCMLGKRIIKLVNKNGIWQQVLKK
jgi:hypothetical protein